MKNFEHMELNDLFVEKNYCEIVHNGYEEAGLDTPEEIILQLSDVTKTIKSVIEGDLRKKLRIAKIRRETLKTPDEKRAGVDAEIKALEEKLA